MARYRWNPRLGLAAAVAVVLVLGSSVLPLVGGCALKPAAANAAPAGVRVSSAELFAGDAKRLEPHLGLTGGCFRLESGYSVVWIGAEVELWQDGKPVRVVASGTHRVEEPNEVSVSLQEVSHEGKPKLKLVIATHGKAGSSSGQWITDKLKAVLDTPQERSTTFAKLERPVDLVEGEHAPVWALLAHEAFGRKPLHAGYTLEDGPKQAVWALVFKVWWEKYLE